MTLIEACKRALEELERPATAKEVYEHISNRNYFNFIAKTPQASVASVLSDFTNEKARLYDKNISYTKINGVNHYSITINTKKITQTEESDIEPEEGSTEENEGIREMFLKAKELDIQMTQWPIFTLKYYLENKIIRFSAEYQRRPDLWDNIKKSRLIESILLRLPLPAFYFDEKRDENGSICYEIIDGLQRLSSLRHFFDSENSLKLQNLEYLGAELNGKTFTNIEAYQNRILAFNVTAYIIKENCPPEVKYNLFKRINTGGLILTDQEIRNALNTGKAVDFLKELADLECFKRATSNAISSRRAEDYDFINRFVAFYLNKDNYQPDMGTFLNQALVQVKKMPEDELAEIKANFIKAMETAWDIFDTDAFRKRYDEDDNRKPINKALFEALSVSLAKLTPEKIKKLIDSKKIMRELFIEYCRQFEFETSIARSTGDKQNVKTRYWYINHLIKSTLMS